MSMRLDPEFAKIVESLVIVAREVSTKNHSADQTVLENLQYLKGRGRPKSQGQTSHEQGQEAPVVDIGAEATARILSSLQVITDGMKTQGEHTRQLGKVDGSTGEPALVELVGKGLAELFFDPDGGPAWVPSLGLLVAAVENPGGWLGASGTVGPDKPRVDDDLRGDIACWFDHGRAHYPDVHLKEDLETMLAILREYELRGDAVAYLDHDGMLTWGASDTFHLEAGGGRCENQPA
jgi:hypothetical protein